MRYQPSKTLARMALIDKRIAEYEYDPAPRSAGCHWLYLTWPWCIDGIGSIHEWTVRQCLRELRRAQPRLDTDDPGEWTWPE